VLAAILEKKSLTDEIKADLKQVLDDFKDTWQRESETGADFAPATARQASTAAAPTA
jgi:hypothetical protein